MRVLIIAEDATFTSAISFSLFRYYKEVGFTDLALQFVDSKAPDCEQDNVIYMAYQESDVPLDVIFKMDLVVRSRKRSNDETLINFYSKPKQI